MHVVVVAYGPRSTTDSAIDRIREWTHSPSELSVVRASAAAEGSARIPAGDVLGTEGVRRAAADSAMPTMVLVHDDAVPSEAAVDALRSVLETADLAIPTTESSGAVNRGCVALRREAIERVSSSLVVPAGTIEAPGATIAAVPVDIEHPGACASHLVEDIADDRPLLVASMIVRDEEQRLPGALESITGIVDRIDVCDTGSDDGTISVIHRNGGNLKKIDWRNDFGWARNQALEMSQDAVFALILDADERVTVDDPERLRRWLRTWTHEIDALRIRIDNDRGDDGVPTSFLAVRLVRPNSSTFEGAIHEVLDVRRSCDQGPGQIVDCPMITIDHIGYLADIVGERNKKSRNVTIARAAHAGAPSLKTTVDLARALLDGDPRSAEAAALLDRAIEAFDDTVTPAGRSLVLAMRAAYELECGDTAESLELAIDALEATAGESLAMVVAAEACTSLGRPHELLALDAALAGRPQGEPIYHVPRNVTRYRTLVAHALVQTGHQDEAVGRLGAVMAEDAGGVADLAAAALTEALRRGASPEAAVPLLQCDATGQIAAAVAAAAPPRTTASVCLAALELGAPHPPLAVTALTAAIVGTDGALAAEAARHAHLLDPVVRAKLADVARAKSMAEVSERLLAAEPAAVATA